MDGKVLSRNVFSEYTEEIVKFESDINQRLMYKPPHGGLWSVRDIPLADLVKKVEAVAADDGLLEVKVIDTVMRAEEEELNVLGNISKVVEMSAVTVPQPLISSTYFKVWAATDGADVIGAGGMFPSVTLNCANQRGLYKTNVDLSRTWIKDHGFGAVEEAVFAAGQAVYYDMASKVFTDLIADKDSTMTNTVANWGNNHYKSLVKGDALIRATGDFRNRVVVINPDEIYDIMTTDVFIHQDYARVANGAPVNGALVGYLYGYIPIYAHRAMTAASMLVLTKGISSIVGMRQAVQFEGYQDVRKGLEGTLISLQYDYKNGYDALPSTHKPTAKSWALITGA